MYHHGELTLQAHQIPCTLLFDRLTIVNVVHPRKKSVKVENNAYTFIEKKTPRTRRKFFNYGPCEKQKFGRCFFFLATVCLFIFFRCCFCWCCFGRYGNLRKRNTKKEWRARAHLMLHWITEIPVCNMTYDKSYDGINVYPGEAKKMYAKTFNTYVVRHQPPISEACFSKSLCSLWIHSSASTFLFCNLFVSMVVF